MATFSEVMDPATLNGSTVRLDYENASIRGDRTERVTATVSCDSPCRTVKLHPFRPLFSTPQSTYKATIKGGARGVKDHRGTPMSGDEVWTFKVEVRRR